MSINEKKCSKDIVNSLRKGKSTGKKIEKLQKIGARLTGMLRSDVLREN